MASTEIIQATLADLDQIVPLFKGYRGFYEQPDADTGSEQFVRDRMTNHESVIFLARRDGDPAGFTQLYPSFSSVSIQRDWILNDLYVAPNHRRHGIARALMLRAIDHARETKAKGLTLSTAVDNESAQALYESLGFVRNTTFYEYAFRF